MDNTVLNSALKGTAQVNGTTESANSVNGDENTKKVMPKKRTYKPQPIYYILGKSRQQFMWQLEKDSATKVACMEAALAANPKMYSDRLRFELDFKAERDRLTDSKRFCLACETLGLEPKNVADHVVFEGKAVLEKVLKNGLQVLGEKVRMFNEPLWVDSEDLYKEEVAHE